MYIDLNRIRRNAQDISRICPLIAVVKADAYGIGALKTAFALANTVKRFAVWTEAEAEELICAGIENDILILGQTKNRIKYPTVIHTVGDRDEAGSCSGGRVAVKINTGMNRMGTDTRDLPGVLSEISRRRLMLDSVYTHLFCPENQTITYQQIDIFDSVTGHMDTQTHVAASKALGYDFARQYDFVRCGIALYRGAAELKAKIIKLRHLKKGEYAGYGDLPLTADADVAVVNIGYRDGYRKLTGERFAFYRGVRCRVLGVCMDVTLIDMSGCCAVVGDTVELLGKNITEDDIGASYMTSEYEAYTFFGRVRKIYAG